MTDNLVRSVRAARMPGLGEPLAGGRLRPALAASLLLAPLPGSTIGVTPIGGAWAVCIRVNVFHVVMQTTLAYRYLVVAPDVPEQPPATARRRPASRAAAETRW